MINVEIDQEQLKELYLHKVEEHLKEIDLEVFFMDSKQLANYLNMSWNTIVSHLLYDEDFPKVRLGSKWLFNRKEVQEFMKNYYVEVRNNGGDILKYKRKGWAKNSMEIYEFHVLKNLLTHGSELIGSKKQYTFILYSNLTLSKYIHGRGRSDYGPWELSHERS